VCFYLEVYKYLEIAYLHPNIESCLIMQWQVKWKRQASADALTRASMSLK
jgi:hypothetical protein